MIRDCIDRICSVKCQNQHYIFEDVFEFIVSVQYSNTTIRTRSGTILERFQAGYFMLEREKEQSICVLLAALNSKYMWYRVGRLWDKVPSVLPSS